MRSQHTHTHTLFNFSMATTPPRSPTDADKRPQLTVHTKICTDLFRNPETNQTARKLTFDYDAGEPCSKLRMRCFSCLLYTSPSPRDRG